MLWTREDEMALASCLRVNRTTARYCSRPIPVYRTLPKLYEALLEAGLIERVAEEPEDACAGCVNHVGGTCRKGYREAELGFRDEKVIRCRLRRERTDPIPAPPTVNGENRSTEDMCDGCAKNVGGNCHWGYQAAELDPDRKRVVKCLLRRERQ